MWGMAEMCVVEAFTPERKYGSWVALTEQDLKWAKVDVRAYNLTRAVRDINRLIAETEPGMDPSVVLWEAHPVNDDD